MPRDCFIITGPSGTNLFGSVKKLRLYLQASSLPVPAVAKLEDHMVAIYSQQFQDKAPLLSQSGGLRHLFVAPKYYLRSIWLDACSRALDTVPADQQPVFLLMHAAFYHNASVEFFSCIDASGLKGLLQSKGFAVRRVLTLIDDCYDVLSRLSERGQVLHPIVRTGATRFDAAAEAVSKLSMILEWRAFEVAWAEDLARGLGAEHFVVAVKHHLSVARDLIFTRKIPVYISHPITAVRALFRQGNDAEARAILEQIDELTDRLRRSEIVTPFSPTAIDEFRIGRHGDAWEPRLEERWPVGSPQDLLFSPPPAPVSNPFDPAGEPSEPVELGIDRAFHALLELFSRRLRNQINWRDRKLVEQSRGLVAYRPYYSGRMSFGVFEEIRHRNILTDHGGSGGGRSACVVLNPSMDLALWKPDYVKRKLKDDAVLEDGTNPPDEILNAVHAHLVPASIIMMTYLGLPNLARWYMIPFRETGGNHAENKPFCDQVDHT